MRSRFFAAVAVATVVVAAFSLGVQPALAQKGGGHGGGGHAGGGHAGGGGSFHAGGAHPGSFGGVYRPGTGAYHYGGSFSHYGVPNNFYRPYYSNYFRPYYSFYPGFAFASYYDPYYYGGLGLGGYPLVGAYGGAYAPGSGGLPPVIPPEGDRPPQDGAFHLQLTVPLNADVLIDGLATTQTGTVREFVSPMLNVGYKYSYKVTVITPDKTGKPVEDTRVIRFQSNDWFSVDFTRPPPTPTLPPPNKEKDE